MILVLVLIRQLYDWFLDHDFVLFGAQTLTGDFLATFKDYPPRQRAASFTIDQAIEKMKKGIGE